MEIEVMPVRIAATYAVIPHMLANPFAVIRHVTTDVYVPIDRTPGNPFINKDEQIRQVAQNMPPISDKSMTLPTNLMLDTASPNKGTSSCRRADRLA